jgi:hypothetical protein
MLYHYLSAIADVLIMIWIILSMQRAFIHPYAYSIIILLFTIVTTTVFILLLLLSFCYCYYYKTVATDKMLWASLLPGAAELTTHLLRLINILWLPLCRINKFRFYFHRRLLRSLYLWVITPWSHILLRHVSQSPPTSPPLIKPIHPGDSF